MLAAKTIALASILHFIVSILCLPLFVDVYYLFLEQDCSIDYLKYMKNLFVYFYFYFFQSSDYRNITRSQCSPPHPPSLYHHLLSASRCSSSTTSVCYLRRCSSVLQPLSRELHRRELHLHLALELP
ncbi:hypothetical protein S83_027154 [Arachis hypogaea]